VKATSAHLNGERILIREFRDSDLQQMDHWRPFDDPLHSLWNLPRAHSLSRDMWLSMHASDPTRLWFVVERRKDGQVIGSVTLREMVRRRSARLGITFGADYVDQGYGSEALSLFLSFFFNELGFRQLLLDVAAANARARHLYEKLGFHSVGHHYRDIPGGQDLSFLQKDEYRQVRPFFRRHAGRTQLLFHDMALDKRDWERVQDGSSACKQDGA
jgi:diamine N-acetyltransferase